MTKFVTYLVEYTLLNSGPSPNTQTTKVISSYKNMQGGRL